MNWDDRYQLLKHYGSVLRMHFGWTICITVDNPWGLRYTQRGESESRFMPESDALTAGYIAENKKSIN